MGNIYPFTSEIYNLVNNTGGVIMIIDFDNMDFLRRENLFGGESFFDAKIFNDGQNRILYGKLEPGASIGFHVHDAGSEMLYIISGKGFADYDGTQERLYPGICHYCPKGHSHVTVNDGNEDLVFFAVVTKE